MVRAKPGLTKEIGTEAMSLATQLDAVHETRRLTQHEIQIDQACKFAEMKRRQDAVAKARPLPEATGRFAKPKPKNEIEVYLAAQPQTTAQHVGHHVIPKMPTPAFVPPENLCAPPVRSTRRYALSVHGSRFQVRVPDALAHLSEQQQQSLRPPPGPPRPQARQRVSEAAAKLAY